MNSKTMRLAQLLVDRLGWDMWMQKQVWWLKSTNGKQFNLDIDDPTTDAVIAILEEMPTKVKRYVVHHPEKCICPECNKGKYYTAAEWKEAKKAANRLSLESERENT